jgi:thiamine biosynthesis lipoprotein
VIHVRSFKAMGTEFELHLECPEADADTLLVDAETEVRRLERMLSRFDPGSELSLLNEQGRRVVAPELAELVQLAVEARERTGGRFDATVHDAVVGAGYDRSFEELRPSSVSPAPAPVARSTRITVDRASGLVELAGCRIDLGGIAKGWTADRLVERLSPAGPALVNAGGDIACAGRSWPIGVETPEGALTIELETGGLATSGRDRRHWVTDAGDAHHLIDPRTGRPADGELLTVTAVAATAAEAETIATSLFLAGSVDRAADEAEALGVPAVLVTRDRVTRLAGGLA